MNKLNTIMNRVIKKCPDAKLRKDEDGYYYIEVNGVNLSAEHLFPPTLDQSVAWSYADTSIKMTQNFNRTHPSRVEAYTAMDKSSRIKKRTGKSRRRNPDNLVGFYSNDDAY